MISENGPELREPYSKHLDDGIKEYIEREESQHENA
jgi:hypothetical protein